MANFIDDFFPVVNDIDRNESRRRSGASSSSTSVANTVVLHAPDPCEPELDGMPMLTAFSDSEDSEDDFEPEDELAREVIVIEDEKHVPVISPVVHEIIDDNVERVARRASGVRQRVVTVDDRVRVLNFIFKYLLDNNLPTDELKLPPKLPGLVHDKFPNETAPVSGARSAALAKIRRWWKLRDQWTRVSSDGSALVAVNTTATSTSLWANGGRSRTRRRTVSKASLARLAPWVKWFDPLLFEAFLDLKAARIKLNDQFLLAFARIYLTKLNHPDFRMSTPVRQTKKDRRENVQRTISDSLKAHWIRRFRERHGIRRYKNSGKKSVSEAKTAAIESAVAKHLGMLKREFDAGRRDEDMENIDETHCVIDMDDGFTLGFNPRAVMGSTLYDKLSDARKEAMTRKYADVVSGGEKMSIVLRATGGEHGKIGVPFVIFKNKDRKDNIRGVPQIEGVRYYTQPRAWMDRAVWKQYLTDPLILPRPVEPERRIQLWSDNCGGHDDGEEFQRAAANRQRILKQFPKAATDLLQPLDSFVIQVQCSS